MERKTKRTRTKKGWEKTNSTMRGKSARDGADEHEGLDEEGEVVLAGTVLSHQYPRIRVLSARNGIAHLTPSTPT